MTTHGTQGSVVKPKPSLYPGPGHKPITLKGQSTVLGNQGLDMMDMDKKKSVDRKKSQLKNISAAEDDDLIV